MMSVVTSNPSGAATSWRMYLPSVRPLTIVADDPDFQISSVSLDLSLNSAPFPRVTSSLLRTIALPSESIPFRLSSAPLSSFPRMSALLIATSTAIVVVTVVVVAAVVVSVVDVSVVDVTVVVAVVVVTVVVVVSSSPMTAVGVVSVVVVSSAGL